MSKWKLQNINEIEGTEIEGTPHIHYCKNEYDQNIHTIQRNVQIPCNS